MNEQEYLESRLEGQIKWLSTNGTKNKKRYKIMRSLVIILSVSIPFLIGLATDATPWLKILAGSLGVLVAALEGLLALNKHQEKWQSYRHTAELLKREKYIFGTKTGVYSGKDAFALLVENVEGILAKENSDWEAYTEKDNDKVG